jgi:hypothetical protein
MKKKTLTSQYDEEYLQMKVDDLRQGLDSLARVNAGAQPDIDEIRNSLESIGKQSLERVRWNLYQLSYRHYIRICPPEELLGIFLGIKSRTYRLDRPNKEIWNEEKLRSIETLIGAQPTEPTLRVEIETLARAIDECGFRFTRDNELKSELHGDSLRWTIFAFFLLLITLSFFAIYHVGPDSQWEELPIILFGVNGGLLSATLQQRRERMYRHTMSTAKAELLFRAVFGAIAAIVVTMLLELRVIDFPFLHVGNSTAFPASALYIVGFASGFTERLFVGAMEKVYPKRSGTTRGQDKKQAQQTDQ